MIVINENSTAVVTLEFLDTNNEAFTPVTVAYQVQKLDGTIINSRSFASGSFTGTRLVLSGPDLAITSDGDTKRILAIQGTFDATYGSNLPFTAEAEFDINNLRSQG